MDIYKKESENLQSLFYPKHIAFIGASESSTLGSMMYLPAFKDSIWANTFYPINPKHKRIMDWKCYPSVLEVPFPIDTAYIIAKLRKRIDIRDSDYTGNMGAGAVFDSPLLNAE